MILSTALALGPEQYAALVLIGLAAGVLGGLLGIGGGLVMIPALQFVLGEALGPGSFHVYKLAAITTSIALSIPAIIRHWQAGAVVPGLVRSIVPAAVAGVFLGVWASSMLADERTYLLRRLFGGFMLAVVAFGIYRRLRPADVESGARLRCPMPNRRALIGACVGFPSGLIAGLLGVGGGVWAVPMQHLGHGVRLRNAIANSACMIVFVAAATSLTHGLAVSRMTGLRALDGWTLAAFVAPGAVVGAWCGAGFAHRIPLTWLRAAVDVLLLVAGSRLLWT